MVNLNAFFNTFSQYLISLSSVFEYWSSLYVCEIKKEEYEEGMFSGASMDWFLLGKWDALGRNQIPSLSRELEKVFAVLTPMSMSISISFSTREEALKQIATYKSYIYPIYLALSSWIWNDNNGKSERKCKAFFKYNNDESSGKREHFIQKDADSIPLDTAWF